jgi:hypothetical protein
MISTARRLAAVTVSGLLLLGGCQQGYRSRPSAATSSACRAEVDRVYSAQNRVDLSTRDQRDTPFAAGYLAGNTTQGLGAAYGRDNLYSSCLNNAADAAPAAVTPTATAAPAAR